MPQTVVTLIQGITNNHLLPTPPADIPGAVRNTMDNVWHHDATKRMTAEQIVKVFRK